MRHITRVLLLALSAALAGAPPLAARSSVGTGVLSSTPQDQAPTFRSSASLIEVDVIVRGRDGAFVAGLTADDFEIYEDGVRQDVQQFYVVEDAGDRTLARETFIASGGRQPTRVFVFLFDQDHLSVDAMFRLKRAAEAFIDEGLGPTDVAAIVADRRIVGGRLTSSKAELRAALREVKPYPDSRARRLRELLEFPRVDSEFEAMRIEMGDARMLREAAERVCNAAPLLCANEGGNDVVRERIDQKARQYVDEARASAGNILQTLSSMATGLARFPGRKTLVLMSEGFFVEESRPALQHIAGQAARSGVTVYSLDGRGLSGSGSREMADAATMGGGLTRAFDTSNDGLSVLAGETGGFVLSNASNFTGALMDIARDTSTYYVVGYAPTNAALDGKFRKIEVKVKADGARVRARKGYLATPLPPQATLRGGMAP